MFKSLSGSFIKFTPTNATWYLEIFEKKSKINSEINLIIYRFSKVKLTLVRIRF